MTRRFTRILAALALLVFMAPGLAAWGQTRESYSVTYNYSDLGTMFVSGSSYSDASSYWKVPAKAGNTATISIPITHQPESNITVTFNIATFGSGTNPSSSNTTITAVGTESNSNWTGSGVSSYPSSSTYVDGVMTITQPQNPTTLGGLTVTMGVNTGVKIFRLKSITVSYTYSGSSTPLDNIAALTANTTAGSYNVTLSNAVVTYVNGNYAYIQDASGAVVYYKSGHGLTAGDVLNGTAAVVYQVRNGNPQITDLSGVNPTSGTAPEPTEVTATGWSYIFNDVLSQYFKVTGATITQDNNKYYISLGGESIQLYKIGQAPTISDFNATYTVIGFPTLYVNNNGTTKELQIFVDPEMEVGTDPVLSVNSTSLSFTYAQGATEVSSEDFTITGSNLTENVIVALPAGNFTMYDGNDAITSPYTLTPSSEGEINETITVKMNAGLEQGNYNGSITIAWEGEEDLTVALNGTVTEPEPENVTWDLTTATYNSASAEQVQWTSNFATMTVDKNGASSNANAYLNSGNPVTTRFYNGQKLTFAAAEGYEIDHVVITGQNGYVSGLNIENWTNASAAADGNVVTVTPTNGNNPFFVIINATIRLTSVTVYYAESTATFYDINIDDDMENGTVVANPDEATEGTMVTLTIFPAAGYYLEENNIMVDVTGVEVTKVNDATYTFTMPASDVTVSAVFSEYTGTYYTLVTSADQLVAGRHYIIASSKTGGAAYAMGAQTNSTYRDQVEAVVVGTMIYETEGVSEIVLNQATSNLWVLYDEDKPGYLYASSVSNNNLGTRAFNNANNPERGQWAISFSDGVANIVSQIEGEDAPNTIRYNAGSSRFSCYPGTQAPVYLYMKANETNYTYVKDINAYEGEGGYVLVASPVSTTPANAGMITDQEGAQATSETATYDFYYFNQAQQLEWINYRRGVFGIEPGKGYLYANKNNVTLTFTGTPNDNGQVTLSKTDDSSVDFQGWNLVGNPFGETAYIGNRSFYVMNEDGTDIEPADRTYIQPMEGVFVIASENNESLTFSTTAQAKGASVAMNVIHERGNVIDRAIVRFDEGDQLPKFQINKNHTKVYITQDNQDYAVVRAEEMGEMPVNFKAENNGNYTLSVNAEEVSFAYLHLIDNMTGNEVDLLQTPSYSFEAKTTDYASRFKLVYATGDNSNSDNFAFFSNGSFVINNDGVAELQVVDIMGRILSSETINGCANVSVNAAPGVYMLRLVNGTDVKVQKVVVK